MTKRLRTACAVTLVLGLAVLAAGPASALEGPASLCASSKLKATGKKVRGKLKCEATAIKKMTTVDPACLTKAETKFAGAFAKAELKGGCISTGDAAAVESRVDLLVEETVLRQTTGSGPLPACTDVGMSCGTCGDGYCVMDGAFPACVSTSSALDGPLGCTSDAQCTAGEYCIGMPSQPPPNTTCAAPCGAVEPPDPLDLDKAARTCASRKLKATGTKVLKKLACQAKAVKANKPVDPECLTKVEGKFTAAFAKAELQGGCVSGGDAEGVEAAVDAFVDDVVALELTVIEPLPSCTELNNPCGTCGDGVCLYHEPEPGCISASSLEGGSPVLCASDTQCPLGEHCMRIVEEVVWPVPIPAIWACADPCP